MLFVDDDEPEIRKRRKQGRTGAYHNACLPARCAEKLAVTLALGELRVDDGDFPAETLFQIANGLKGQVDFRQQ